MRRAFALLVDPTHRLPVPGRPGREFAAEGETIDADDPFWLNCLADGSIAFGEPPVEMPAPVEAPLAEAPIAAAAELVAPAPEPVDGVAALAAALQS
jgi:hypothetical protein